MTFNQLPQEWNPSEGYVWTANSKTNVIKKGYSNYLSWRFFEDARQLRIEQLLKATNSHDITSMNNIQTDIYDWYAPFVIPVILSTVQGLTESTEIAARDQLSQWNYNYDLNSIGSSVYKTVFDLLQINIIQDELTVLNLTKLISDGRFFHLSSTANFIVNDTSLFAHNWFDNVSTPQIETKNDTIKSTFQAAVAQLKDKFSSDVSKWTWSKTYPSTWNHNIGGSVSLFSFLNSGPFPAPGSDGSVRARWNSGGQSLRLIADFGGDKQTSLIVPPGASGVLFSPWYKNQIPAWVGTSTYIIPKNADEVQNLCSLVVKFEVE
jgi:penicillin amidase